MSLIYRCGMWNTWIFINHCYAIVLVDVHHQYHQYSHSFSLMGRFYWTNAMRETIFIHAKIDICFDSTNMRSELLLSNVFGLTNYAFFAIFSNAQWKSRYAILSPCHTQFDASISRNSSSHQAVLFDPAALVLSETELSQSKTPLLFNIQVFFVYLIYFLFL